MADLRTAASVEEAFAMLEKRLDSIDRKKRAADEVFRVQTTTNSATWTNATKVVTNLAGTFTAVKGLTYRAHAVVHVINNVAETESLMIATHAGGAITNADTGTPMGLRTIVSGAIASKELTHKFTATADGTYGVGVIGWKPTGDTNAARLFGDPAYCTNELWVEIVA